MENSTIRRLLTTLFAAQGLQTLGLMAALTIGTIAAEKLTGDARLAGLPSTVALLGTAAGAYPAGRLMDRFGRRLGITFGFALGAGGAATAALAMGNHLFTLLLAGYLLLGLARGAIDQARFAAAEVVPPAGRGRAVSWVVLAGTIGGIGGPLLIGPAGTVAQRLGLEMLAGPFLGALLAYLAGAITIFLFLWPEPSQLARERLPEPTEAPTPSPEQGRSFVALMEVGAARAALIALILGQAIMVTVMVITPLHMEGHAHDLDAVSWVLATHVTGMFALSVLTGRFADQWGRGVAIRVGALLLAGGCLLAPLSHNVLLLAGALFLLGLGWNFCYVSGSSLLADLLRPEERGRLQGTFDLLVALTSATASLSSGFLFAQLGYAGLATTGLLLACLLLAASLWSDGRPLVEESWQASKG